MVRRRRETKTRRSRSPARPGLRSSRAGARVLPPSATRNVLKWANRCSKQRCGPMTGWPQLIDCQQGLGQLQAQLVERISAAIHGEQPIVRLGLQGEQTLAAHLLETAQEADPELVSLAGEIQQGREHLLGMVVELAQQ